LRTCCPSCRDSSSSSRSIRTRCYASSAIWRCLGSATHILLVGAFEVGDDEDELEVERGLGGQRDEVVTGEAARAPTELERVAILILESVIHTAAVARCWTFSCRTVAVHGGAGRAQGDDHGAAAASAIHG
jgi:hypothetical protein